MNGILPDLLPLAAPIESLKPLAGNPRKGDVDAIKRSYAKFGQRKPIVVRRGTGEVLAGNHQLLAAKALGWDSIAVVWVDDDDETAKGYVLADNRLGELGGYDEAALGKLIEDLSGSPDLLLDAGFDSAAIEEAMAKAHFTPDLAKPVDMDMSKIGDGGESSNLYRLHCGRIHLHVTEDEYQAFKAAVDQHTQRHATAAGFFRAILGMDR